MKTYLVTKPGPVVSGGLNQGAIVIEVVAKDYYTSFGTLTFHNRKGGATRSFAPGTWLEVEVKDDDQ